MIETMTAQNDNESKQLSFPIQIREDDSMELSDGELMAESRLILTQYLNKVSRGEAVLTDKLKAYRRHVNGIFSRMGYQTIDGDFD